MAYQVRREILDHQDSMFLVLQVTKATQGFQGNLVSKGPRVYQGHPDEMEPPDFQGPRETWDFLAHLGQLDPLDKKAPVVKWAFQDQKVYKAYQGVLARQAPLDSLGQRERKVNQAALKLEFQAHLALRVIVVCLDTQVAQAVKDHLAILGCLVCQVIQVQKVIVAFPGSQGPQALQDQKVLMDHQGIQVPQDNPEFQVNLAALVPLAFQERKDSQVEMAFPGPLDRRAIQASQVSGDLDHRDCQDYQAKFISLYCWKQ
ncbi:UNVERIFIED_CONTAM: hypothetical protein K2H54_047330 [Gekko kuhli]